MDTPDQPEAHLPPWEQPGAVRRDCEPHRGDFLAWLSIASSICGAPPSCIYWPPLSLFAHAPSVIGLPLGILVFVLARRDLARMRCGLMDPAGQRSTNSARIAALVGVVLNAIALVGLLRMLAHFEAWL